MGKNQFSKVFLEKGTVTVVRKGAWRKDACQDMGANVLVQTS